jgi:Zn-dependent peptidase ImmA (M78 family)
MNITRLDLDGTGSPEGLVTRILKAEPGLTYPIPLEELCKALDIIKIAELTTDAFEGSLLMDQHRSHGIILVNKNARDGRRRFTIGHELGHFLIPTHMPVKGDAFLCSRDDMRLWSPEERDKYRRMEVEANRFSGLLLMPPPMLRNYLAKRGDPTLADVEAIHSDFDVSKDAAARAYAQHHDQPIAIAVVQNGKVLRLYRHIKFPQLSVDPGNEVPKGSAYWRAIKSKAELTEISEVLPGQWLASGWGRPLPELYEQVLLQRLDYALIMLWPEFPEGDDDFDPDENRTAKERLADRKGRWGER